MSWTRWSVRLTYILFFAVTWRTRGVVARPPSHGGASSQRSPTRAVVRMRMGGVRSSVRARALGCSTSSCERKADVPIQTAYWIVVNTRISDASDTRIRKASGSSGGRGRLGTTERCSSPFFGVPGLLSVAHTGRQAKGEAPKSPDVHEDEPREVASPSNPFDKEHL